MPTWILTTILLALLAAPTEAQDRARVAVVAELTGGGAPVGLMWKNGVLLAVEEINAAGGILGRKVDTTVLDTQSDPPTSVAVMRRAVGEKPIAILGPVYSSSTVANMTVAQQAGIPQVTGSEAAIITQKGNPFIFRTSFGQDVGMAKMVKWLLEDLKAERIGLMWVNNAFGKGGRDVIVQYLKDRGKELAADMATEVQQADFTAELTRVRASGAQTLILYLHEEESARAIRAFRKLGLAMEVVGETTLCTQTAINVAGDAVNGAKCHVGLSPDAPLPRIRELTRKFQAKYGEKPDHNGLKGYLGTYMIKVAAERARSLEPDKIAAALRGVTLSADKEPGLLMDLVVDEKGDVDRESFLVEVKAGKQEIVRVLQMLRGPKK